MRLYLRVVLIALLAYNCISCTSDKYDEIHEITKNSSHSQITYAVDASCSVCIVDCLKFLSGIKLFSKRSVVIYCEEEHYDKFIYYLEQSFGRKASSFIIVSTSDRYPFNMIKDANVCVTTDDNFKSYFYFVNGMLIPIKSTL